MEDNAFLRFLKELPASLWVFLGGVVAGLMPIVGKPIVDKLSGKSKQEGTESVAKVLDTLTNTLNNIAVAAARVDAEKTELHKLQLAEAARELKDALLECDKKDKERLATISLLEKQVEKFKRVHVFLNNQLAQVKAEKAAYLKQLKKARITPTVVPNVLLERK